MNSFQQPGPPQQGWPQNDDINSFKNPMQQPQGWPSQPPQQQQQQIPGVLNGNPQNNVSTWNQWVFESRIHFGFFIHS